MTQKPDGAVVAGPQAVDLNAGDAEDAEMSSETATRLRALCTQTSERYDGTLTEAQAQERITALRDLHGLD